MSSIDEYLLNLSELRKERLLAVITYIRTFYPEAEQSMNYAPNTKMPTFKIDGTYLSIASMKHNITIHFGKYGATEFVAKANPKIVKRVGCVNISDRIDFPINEIKQAIDFCFENTQTI